MKNKKILIISLIIICLVIIGILFFKKKATTDNTIFSFDKNEVLNICVNIENGSDCGTDPFDIYKKITVGTNVEGLKNLVETINKETSDYYEKSSNSKLEGNKCNNLSDKYLHNYRVSSEYFQYDGDNYITIGVFRYEQYLCENVVNSLMPNVYIYSKKDKKIISQKEFREELGIADSDIKNLVGISADNTYLIYDEDGLLFVAYPNIKTGIMQYNPIEL